MPDCADCETEMELEDSYREYITRMRFRGVKVYECPNCGNRFEKKGAETIA